MPYFFCLARSLRAPAGCRATEIIRLMRIQGRQVTSIGKRAHYRKHGTVRRRQILLFAIAQTGAGLSNLQDHPPNGHGWRESGACRVTARVQQTQALRAKADRSYN